VVGFFGEGEEVFEEAFEGGEAEGEVRCVGEGCVRVWSFCWGGGKKRAVGFAEETEFVAVDADCDEEGGEFDVGCLKFLEASVFLSRRQKRDLLRFFTSSLVQAFQSCNSFKNIWIFISALIASIRESAAGVLVRWTLATLSRRCCSWTIAKKSHDGEERRIARP
jgi:hypothetical protein